MRRTLLLAAAVGLSLTACETPGSNVTVQAVHCALPAARSAPAMPETAYEPAWRTYRDPADGLSITLPDSWGGVFLGTGHVDRDISALGTRLPDVAAGLRQQVADLGDGYRFTAISDPAALYVRPADSANPTEQCAATAEGYLGPGGTVRAYAIQLGRRHAAELLDRPRSGAGNDDPPTYLEFYTRPLGSQEIYNLEFSTFAQDVAAVEPVAWRIVASLSRLPAGPAVTCVFTDRQQPAVGLPAGDACPVPVGDQARRLDCPLPDPQSDSATYRIGYDVRPPGVRDEPTVLDSRGSCAVSVQPGGTVAITPSGGAAAQTAIVADLWMPGDVARATATLSLPLRDGHDVVADLRLTGELAVSERVAGVRRPALGTEPVAPLGRRSHRLALAVSGNQVEAWLDGRSYGPFTTTVTAQPGEARVLLQDGDPAVPAGFELQGIATYGFPASSA